MNDSAKPLHSSRSDNGLSYRVSSQLSLGARIRRWLQQSRTQTVFVAPRQALEQAPPIFLIGVHRSGTTLLRLIIDSHSRIACPTESIFLLPLSSMWRDHKALDGLQAMGFTEEHVVRKLREFSSYYFNAYASSKGKLRWADKSPHYVDCLDFIERLYGPECQYVFIFRHGLDAACSIGEREIRQSDQHKQDCGDAYVGAARYWATQCQKMIEFKKNYASRVYEIRYESLVTEPDAVGEKLFEFLDERWEPEVLEFYRRSHSTHAGLEDPIASTSRGFKPSIGNYYRLPQATIARMLDEAGATLHELQYEV